MFVRYISLKGRTGMKKSIELIEKKVSYAAFQFILPFTIKRGKASSLISAIEKVGFERFQLEDQEMQKRYYGEFNIHHADIEHYFLPYTNRVLFPPTNKDAGFQRYSKKFDLSCTLQANNKTIPFTILSADIVICPFELAFLNIRTKISDPSNLNFSEAIEFGARFRVLEPRTSRDVEMIVEHEATSFDKVEDFIFDFLLPQLESFLDDKIKGVSYSFNLFDDKRMYVQSLFCMDSNEKIEMTDIYRAGNLNGLDTNGEPYISSNNPAYIQQFVEEKGYEKWAPNTYYMMEKNSFSCLTNERPEILSMLASQMYGEYYYGLLLNLFHKMVVLNIDILYSEVNISRDKDEIEKLIHFINTFTANYYFIEITTKSQGYEIFWRLRKEFRIEALYKDARETLLSLYKYQEGFSAKKNNMLLLILTLYTVIGGIYGMNLVIEDLKGSVKWEKLSSYSIFEYIALFVTLSGLFVSIVLGVQEFVKWRKDRVKQKIWEREEE